MSEDKCKDCEKYEMCQNNKEERPCDEFICKKQENKEFLTESQAKLIAENIAYSYFVTNINKEKMRDCIIELFNSLRFIKKSAFDKAEEIRISYLLKNKTCGIRELQQKMCVMAEEYLKAIQELEEKLKGGEKNG